MSESPAYRLHAEDHSFAAALDGVREGKEGRIVIRVTRKLANHPAYDPAEDVALEQLLTAFVALLEGPDGTFTEIVRLSAPRGAELRDVGKWALEYALVGSGSLHHDQPEPTAIPLGELLG